MALEDVGHFVKWIFDFPEKSNGINLEMATDQVSFSDIVSAYTRLNNRKAYHRHMPLNEYLVKYEPYPDAPANWADGSGAKATMTWRQNFTAWWKFWGSGKGATRDITLLNDIYPDRIQSLEEWMRRNNYEGPKKGAVLKNIADLAERKIAG